MSRWEREWNSGFQLAAAAAKLLQTLCNPIDGSPPGSPIPGILQARTLEWVAISFSNAWKWKVKVKSLSCARLFTTPWTAASQAPPSMGFSRQEYWSGVPFFIILQGLDQNLTQARNYHRSSEWVFSPLKNLQCFIHWSLWTATFYSRILSLFYVTTWKTRIEFVDTVAVLKLDLPCATLRSPFP